MGYSKLFDEITDSSIWYQPDHIKVTWLSLLAKADRTHVARVAVPQLARINGHTIDQTEDALGVLMAPDPHSRSEEFEGRRIEKVDGGYLILNRAKYQKMRSEEERREYKRQKAQEYYERDKEKAPKAKAFKPPGIDELRDYMASKGGGGDAQRFHDFYTSKNWMVGKNKMKDWKAAARNWIRRNEDENGKRSPSAKELATNTNW